MVFDAINSLSWSAMPVGVGVWADAGAAYATSRARTKAMHRFQCWNFSELGNSVLTVN
jgi:hypothetical protein